MSWELETNQPPSLTEARVITAVTTAVEHGGPDAAERAAEYIESKVHAGKNMKTERKHKLSEVTFSINLPQTTVDDLVVLADRMENVQYPCRGYGRASAVRELIRLGLPALKAAIEKMERDAGRPALAALPEVSESTGPRPEPMF